MKLIISTIGTSLLTNQVQGDERSELIKAANLSEKSYVNSLISLLDYTKDKIKKKLETATEADLRKLSAELNGILGIYDGVFPKINKDLHVLISTDTYQGKITADIIANFLNSKGFQCIIYTPQKLTTENKSNFTNGIKDLLKWLDSYDGLNIEKYRESKYEIIFNLTGGFKSLQGYLNTIGMFYADRLVYIFESGNELIEIPKLPIEINPHIFELNAVEFAMMYYDFPCEAKTIPSLMLEQYDKNQYILSDWGVLAWNKVKKELFSKKLLSFSKLYLDESFQKDFKNATSQQRIDLQEVLTKVNIILEQNADGVSKMKQDGGIKYDNYAGKNSNIGHFRINQGDRVSCIANNNHLTLRHFGQHDYVNTNP